VRVIVLGAGVSASIRCLIVGLVGLLCCQVVLGDEIVMANGDRLTGTILEDTQETILLRTDYLGIVRIDRRGVQAVDREPAQTELLAAAPIEPDLDQIPATVADATADGDAGAHVDAGAKGTDAASGAGAGAASDAPPSSDPGDSAPQPAVPTSVAGNAQSSQPSPFTPDRQFSGRVNLALSDERGNTDKNEIDVDYQLEYRQGWHRFRSLGALEFDTNDSEKITEKWSTFNQYSRLFPSRWYGAAWLSFDHDRFSDLRLRTVGGPSLGYLAFESEALNLSIEGGPTLLQEDFYGQPDQDFSGVSWLLRYDQLVWQERLQPYHRQFGYIALDGKDKVLWQSWTGIRMPLAGGLSASIEFEYDYDSNPALRAKTTDTTLNLKLGYAW